MNTLSINNVTKSYGKFTALNNINYEFTNGIYALLAPNGAGKTTLLKLLTTLYFPNEGDISFNNKNIIEMGASYRDLLGYLPQDFGYYSNYNPTKYLLYIANLKGIPYKEAKVKVQNVIELVGLSEVKNKKIKKFSGGMKQRVGIAQALLNDPKILILDEPTAGLDPKERVRIRTLISKLSKDRIIIISTHIVSDIESIAKEVVFIKNKEIFLTGSVNQIIDRIENCVWEVTDQKEDNLNLSSNQTLLQTTVHGHKQYIRIYSEEKPFENAVSVDATLEDAFMQYYKEEQSYV